MPRLAVQGVIPETMIDDDETHNTQIARIVENWMGTTLPALLKGDAPVEPHNASQEEIAAIMQAEDSKEAIVALENIILHRRRIMDRYTSVRTLMTALCRRSIFVVQDGR